MHTWILVTHLWVARTLRAFEKAHDACRSEGLSLLFALAGLGRSF